MPDVGLTLEVHALNPLFGRWCVICALPSVIEVPVLVVDAATLRVLGRPVWRQCQDCGLTTSSFDA